MTQVVEIEGNLVRIVRRDITAELPLEDALPFLENRVPVTMPILPVNHLVTACYNESVPGVKKLELLIQLPPAVRHLDYTGELPDLPSTFAFPHTLFFVRASTNADNPRGQDWDLTHIRVYWSKDPIEKLDQVVIPALLPNIYADGRVCWWTATTEAAQPLHKRIDETVNNFHLTGFTDHNVRPFEWPWHSRNYKRWARATEKYGRDAYKRIPEFDPDNVDVTHYTIQSLFETTPSDEIIVSPDGIPQLRFTPTFGRAVEWVRELEDAQIYRLERAIQIVREENPDRVIAPAAPEPEEDDEDEI